MRKLLKALRAPKHHPQCWWCETPITPNDRHRWGMHVECEFAGAAGHLVECCTCCPPPDGRGQWGSEREKALAAWERRRMLDDLDN